jgi:magnesium chelatase family protein
MIKLQDFPKQEHVKRALEVAMVGKHSITLIGSPVSEGRELVEWLRWSKYPTPAYFVSPCPCGYFGFPSRECTCSISMVGRHQAKYLSRDTDIYVTLKELSPDEIINFMRNKNRNEEEEKVYERIKLAKAIEAPRPLELTSTDWNLLKSAVSQLNLSFFQVKQILVVAKTIQHMALVYNTESSFMPYLAEAIQYRPKVG